MEESFSNDAEQTNQQWGKAETSTQENAFKPQQVIEAALYRAAVRGHTDTVKVLLESLTPDERLECLKAKREEDRTALRCAAEHGRTDTVKVLLESLRHNERLECLKAKDECGRTTLHCAAWLGRTDTVKVLLESLAPDERLECLKAKDECGRTALHLAAVHGHTDTVKVLLERLRHNERLEYLKAKDERGMTALHWAAVRGHTDTVKVLLESLRHNERLECLKAKDAGGRTTLHCAAWLGRTDTVKVLLERLTHDERLEYLKAEDERGRTALHCAAHKVDTINYLIRSTKPEQLSQLLSSRIHDQDTPLMLMAKKNDSEVISLVLRLLKLTQRFDCMKMQGKNGQTVLHALSANKQKADQSKISTVVSLTGRFAAELLKIKDTDGNTPADVAETENIKELLTRRLKTYNLNRPPHVIIFWIKKGRDGGVKEFRTMHDLFTSLGIQPITFKDFSCDEVTTEIQKSITCHKEDLSALIVIIMSHGYASSVLDKNKKSLLINDVLAQMSQLTDSSHPSVQIPKVLIVQACRKATEGGNLPRRGTLTKGYERVATIEVIQPDFLVLFAALDGQAAKRNYMLPLLAKRIRDSLVGEDLLVIVRDTSHEMENEREEGKNERVPQILYTMRRLFCLKDFVQ